MRLYAFVCSSYNTNVPPERSINCGKASYYILVAGVLVLLIAGDVSCILKPRNRLKAICHGTRYRRRKLSSFIETTRMRPCL